MTHQLDSRTRDAIDLAVEIEQEDARAAGSIVFQSRIWCQLSLPHRPPPNDPLTGEAPTVWIRKNGSLTLRLRPGLVVGTDGERYGYPYGTMPRYLLTWISTMIIQGGPGLLSDGLTLDMGGSMRAFLRQIGVNGATGGSRGSVTRLRDQITRLATCSVIISNTRTNGDGLWNFRAKNFGFVDEVDLWWSDRPTQSDTLWPNTITISPAFRDSIKVSSVPLDTRGLALIQQAKAGPLALDLYTWLAHRMFSLRRTTTVPWALLSEQFGSQYDRVRNFKANVIKTLPVVRLAYPGVNVTPTADGLVLRPSPLPVARKIVLDI